MTDEERKNLENRLNILTQRAEVFSVFEHKEGDSNQLLNKSTIEPMLKEALRAAGMDDNHIKWLLNTIYLAKDPDGKAYAHEFLDLLQEIINKAELNTDQRNKFHQTLYTRINTENKRLIDATFKNYENLIEPVATDNNDTGGVQRLKLQDAINLLTPAIKGLSLTDEVKQNVINYINTEYPGRDINSINISQFNRLVNGILERAPGISKSSLAEELKDVYTEKVRQLEHERVYPTPKLPNDSELKAMTSAFDIMDGFGFRTWSGGTTSYLCQVLKDGDIVTDGEVEKEVLISLLKNGAHMKVAGQDKTKMTNVFNLTEEEKRYVDYYTKDYGSTLNNLNLTQIIKVLKVVIPNNQALQNFEGTITTINNDILQYRYG